MRLVTIMTSRPVVGAVIGDLILDISSARPFIPHGLKEILQQGFLPEVRNLVDNAAELKKEHFILASEAAFCPPVTDPGKIVCLGLNYLDHALEQDREVPAKPMLFSKAPTAITGPFDDIVITPGTESVDAEAELAVVIGREGRSVKASEAKDYIAGFMAFNDVSARKDQRADRQWFRAKSYDTFAPCGPWLVTPDETGDYGDLRIIQRLNGTIMQESNTSNMVFGVEEIIEYVSSGMTLMPGDIISTGTPAGVGLYRDPQVFLGDGDIVEIEIERIGTIRNRVRAGTENDDIRR